MSAIALSISIAIALVGLPMAFSDAGCTEFEAQTTGCISGTLDGPDAVIGGNETTPGSPGSGGGGGSNGNGGGSGGPVDPVPCPVVIDRCVGTGGDRGGPPTPPSALVTLSDIARFRPAPGVQYMQPDGWMVVGLDANFYAVVDRQVQNGILLGRPADVRFTPVAYHWAYGDGSSATRSTKGATWSAQGLREFDPTPTSHVYGAAGEYVITLTIDFAAEYRFNGGAWTPIAGRLPLPANELRITVTGAKTVLVEHDCRANPAGPGC